MIVLDTHILIWDALEPAKLSQLAKEAIAAANQTGEIWVADISLWEIAMLIQKGRIQVSTDVQTFLNLVLQANNIQLVAISPEIAAQSVQLSATINADPADRLIAATTIVKQATLVTADRNLRSASQIATIW